MSIKNKLEKRKPSISFEIFPPKKNYPVDTIYKTIDDLRDLNPDFISVTYGAGGSTKDRTVDIASYIENKYDLSALAHLTCLTETKEEIDNILKVLDNNGVSNILALRGDYPKDYKVDQVGDNHYRYVKDLISHIKEEYNFSIGAACYPEKHPESNSLKQDLVYLKEKVDAGTDFLVTQLFFDNEIFYKFKEETEKLNINVPIIAGILPVLKTNQVKRILQLTDCHFPKKFTRIIEKYEHNPDALKEAGIAYAVEQIIDLLSSGIDGIHIYTMNNPENTRKILSSLSNIRNALTNHETI